MAYHISIAGGDSRQFYMLHDLIIHLSSQDFFIKYYHPSSIPLEYKILENSYSHIFKICQNPDDLFSDCQIFIGPTPFSKDKTTIFSPDSELQIPLNTLFNLPKLRYVFGGNLPDTLVKNLPAKTITFDFMKNDFFQSVNSELTAEGLLKNIISETPISLPNSKILISGYGNCGKAIADKLSALQAQITIYDYQKNKMDLAHNAGYQTMDLIQNSDSYLPFTSIINTVPSRIFDTSFLRKLKKSCVLFDIASAPGGFDENICKGLALRLVNCPGIPGATAPQTAGCAMSQSILTQLQSATF